MKLHLGCGHDWMEGYINCDISPEVNPDKVVDLENTLPFKDSSVDEIIANHVLEHIRNFVPLMHEFHRICKDGTIIKIKVPFYTSCEQATDPTHVRVFTPFTFDYFDVQSNIGKYSHEVGCDGKMFKINNVNINYSVGRTKILNFIFNSFINLNHRAYCKLFANILPAAEIEFELMVTK